MKKCPISSCGCESADDSNFCEECGTPLGDASATPAANAAPVSPEKVCPSCKAGPVFIDAEGFCTQCGTQRKRPPRDHFEVVLSPAVKTAGVSDIGKKHHDNEDYFAIGEHEGKLALVVCDGTSNSQNPMLGSKAASEAARDSLLEALKAGEITDPDAVVEKAVFVAQEAICKTPFTPGHPGKRGEPLPPAQATMVIALVIGRRITIGWVGDSRAYWCSASGVRQLTSDHSWVNEIVAAGKMSREEAEKHKLAHAITQSLGAADDGSNPGVEGSVLTFNLTESGRLLVVSDGFWNYADKEAQVAQLMTQFSADVTPLTLARALVDFANKAGGHDNITVVASQF